MQLYGWQAKFLGNFRVLDFPSLFQRQTLDSFRQIGTRGDGAAAAKGFELDVRYDAVVVHTYLEFHDIAAPMHEKRNRLAPHVELATLVITPGPTIGGLNLRRSSHKACANIQVVLWQ